MRALRPGDTLLLGAVRAEAMTADAPAFNTLYAVRRLRDDIEIIGLYDKHRLVPFGEYLPFKPVLHAIGFQSLVPVPDGFQSGPAPAPLKLGDRIIQPLICYEGLFPGFTGQGGRVSGQRASLIVNISDDAWFGPTSGPRQHLNQAAYRAIEEGLPMVRSTPTGVSAVIDAKGRIQHNLGMGMRGVLDGDIPAGGSPTPYNRWGDSFFGGMLAVSSLIAARRRRVPSKVA